MFTALGEGCLEISWSSGSRTTKFKWIVVVGVECVCVCLSINKKQETLYKTKYKEKLHFKI